MFILDNTETDADTDTNIYLAQNCVEVFIMHRNRFPFGFYPFYLLSLHRSLSVYTRRNIYEILCITLQVYYGKTLCRHFPKISSNIFTFHKRSCGKVMLLHLSVILFIAGRCTPPWGRHPHGQTPPPPRQPLQRTVRILLECILVC